jgi:diamine N-acetyltransferase
MIDRSHQQKGYGKAALKEIIKTISEKPDGNEILICYQNANQAARNLYASLGFIEQDISSDGKVTALLEMNSVVP